MDENDEVSVPEVKQVFEYTDTTYCPVWNETAKRFDMLVIRVHGPTEQVEVHRQATRYDTKVRALHDVISRISAEFVKK